MRDIQLSVSPAARRYFLVAWLALCAFLIGGVIVALGLTLSFIRKDVERDVVHMQQFHPNWSVLILRAEIWTIAVLAVMVMCFVFLLANPVLGIPILFLAGAVLLTVVLVVHLWLLPRCIPRFSQSCLHGCRS